MKRAAAAATMAAILMILQLVCGAVVRGQSASDVPPNSVFTPPAPNICQSNYDRYYETEPGVYAYWAVCEPGIPGQFYDYVGRYDLTKANHAWWQGLVAGGRPGPVADGETAGSVTTGKSAVEGQGIAVNTNAGTIALWIDTDATAFPVTAVFLGAVGGKSLVSVGANADANGICFNGTFANSDGATATATKCGYAPDTWHRVTFVWTAGTMTLYVDGGAVASGSYSGSLDNRVFYYKLFPGCCVTNKQMTVAKVLVANEAWDQGQVQADVSPAFPSIPAGGVYISSQKLGTIHKDVLGYSDYNENISTAALRGPLLAGIAAAGFTSVRQAGGYVGIKADLGDWRGGVMCTKTMGVTAPAWNATTDDRLDTFLPEMAQPLKLDVVYTVNYGTNPPDCNAGGDPTANGADLVEYANVTKNYGIKRWEIGNELFSHNTETDFHPNPNTGASYVEYEPAFYSAMKAKDSTIAIGVPVSLFSYGSQSGFDLPVLAGSKYDAVIWHSYPVVDPVTDGDTLYTDRVASSVARTRANLLLLQTEILNNGHVTPDSIWITEWNEELFGDKWSKQTMGAVAPLYVVSQLAEFMQAGVKMATWHAEGGTSVCSTQNYDPMGDTAYSWWGCGATAPIYPGPMSGVGEVDVGLTPGELTPAGRGFQILSESGFVTEGETMLRTFSDPVNAPWLESYAATHGSKYAVILINRDRDSAHDAHVRFPQDTSGGSALEWTYGRAQYDASKSGDWSKGPVLTRLGSWGQDFVAKLPAWSVNVYVFGN
jgi:hypothetical protein